MSDFEFGLLLRRTRLSKNITLADLAQKIGVSTVYLSRVELGKSAAPVASRILQIAAAMDVDPHALLHAATWSRPSVDVPNHDTGRRLAAAMMRAEPSWTEEEFRRYIVDQLSKKP